MSKKVILTEEDVKELLEKCPDNGEIELMEQLKKIHDFVRETDGPIFHRNDLTDEEIELAREAIKQPQNNEVFSSLTNDLGIIIVNNKPLLWNIDYFCPDVLKAMIESNKAGIAIRSLEYLIQESKKAS